jgi:hypothetical protein
VGNTELMQCKQAGQVRVSDDQKGSGKMLFVHQWRGVPGEIKKSRKNPL